MHRDVTVVNPWLLVEQTDVKMEVPMRNRVEEAERLFKEGYNCSQSVFAAFSDLYGLDSDTALRVAASFGGGLGRMREVCGAVSGMNMIVGLETGSSQSMDPTGKKHNYDVVQKLTGEFKDISGSIICRELLGLKDKDNSDTTPQDRTKEYYKKRLCVQLVKDAAEILERFLYDVLIMPAETQEQIMQAAELADEIWHEHYDSLLGSDQVNYMLEKFQSQAAMTRQIKDQGYHYCLLVNPLNQDEIAGYFGYQLLPGELFLSKLYIAKKYRGRDFSRRVLEDLKQLGTSQGLFRIWLTVNKYNAGSIAAYEKLGFTRISTQVADIGSGYVMDDYVMEILL